MPLRAGAVQSGQCSGGAQRTSLAGYGGGRPKTRTRKRGCCGASGGRRRRGAAPWVPDRSSLHQILHQGSGAVAVEPKQSPARQSSRRSREQSPAARAIAGSWGSRRRQTKSPRFWAAMAGAPGRDSEGGQWPARWGNHRRPRSITGAASGGTAEAAASRGTPSGDAGRPWQDQLPAFCSGFPGSCRPRNATAGIRRRDISAALVCREPSRSTRRPFAGLLAGRGWAVLAAAADDARAGGSPEDTGRWRYGDRRPRNEGRRRLLRQAGLAGQLATMGIRGGPRGTESRRTQADGSLRRSGAAKQTPARGADKHALRQGLRAAESEDLLANPGDVRPDAGGK